MREQGKDMSLIQWQGKYKYRKGMINMRKGKIRFKWKYLIYVATIVIVGVATSSAGGLTLVRVVGGELNMTITNITTTVNTTINTTVFQFNGTATEDLNMHTYSIFNATWMNGTNMNTSQICLGNNCQTTWPSGTGYTGANVSTTTCSAGYHIAGIDNSTGEVNCTIDTGGGAYNISYEYWSNATLTDYCYNSSYLTSYTETDPYYYSNPYNYTNTSGGAYNESYEYWSNATLTDYCYNSSYLTSYTETDPLWTGNYSLFNDTWVSTFNSTYDAKPSIIFNSSYEYWSNSTLVDLCFNASYMTSTYNTTYHAYIVANISAMTDYIANATERILFLSTYNSTYDAKPSNTYNATYDLKFNTTAISNLNMWNYNITNVTYVGKSSQNITFNGTCSIIWGATSVLEVC